jgi:PIN domain nuclease of toxin-antitoxin system
MNYVLDSSAVICFLRDEPGADAIEKLLLDAESKFFVKINKHLS